MEGQHYTQINVMFPSDQVELPSAEKFTAFPPEAQKAILEAFKIEQSERHSWLKNQQSNEHALNMLHGKYYYRWKLAGTVGGILIVLVALVGGCWLVLNHASGIGVSLMIGSITALALAAIYGRSSSDKGNTEDDDSESRPNGSDQADSSN